MRYLSLGEILELYRRVMATSGGATGIRDQGALESAIAQPRMTFDGEELYTTLTDKAVALGFSLINNHPFVDGNKRLGHAAMEVMLVLNGFQIVADVDDQERTILAVASGTLDREGLGAWLTARIQVS
jgi:death-on-curing protein